MITAQVIAKAKPGDVLPDPAHRGLRLVVGGTKTRWQSRYREGAQLKQTVLGHFPAMSILDAQLAWGDAARDRREGTDPAQAVKVARKALVDANKPVVRVKDIVQAYLTEHVEK